MNKRDLKKLALLGFTSGILISNSSSVNAADTSAAKDTSASKDANDGNLGYHLMSEKELLMELNGSGVALYNGLDAKGKELARQVASQRCNGTNECKGLNACQTDHNECAGKGSCKNTSKCAIADKNLAVKLVADKMKQKRSSANE